MPESAYSPSYDSPEPEEAHGLWEWNHFEVRTLVCLIIKGEHRVSKDPMDLTDKLNHALNPASSGKQPAYSRDVPHAEVQAMLKRILSKKSHAVDLCERSYSYPVTRTQVNAFMRNLDFNGSQTEWEEGRQKRVKVETQKRLERYMNRKDGGRPSPRSRDERDRRRMLLRDPRAKRLLRGWGIGASFWEDKPNTENRPVNRGEDGNPVPATVNPARYSYNTNNAPYLPTAFPPARNGGFSYTPNIHTPVATWAGGFASTAATPRTGEIAPPPMSIMPGPDSAQQATMLDYGGFGGFGSLGNPQQQPYQWVGDEQNGAWGAGGAQAGDHPSSGSQHAGRGF